MDEFILQTQVLEQGDEYWLHKLSLANLNCNFNFDWFIIENIYCSYGIITVRLNAKRI